MLKLLLKYSFIPISLLIPSSLFYYTTNKLDKNFQKTLIEIIQNQRM